ncbi:ABC transporter ATP-binding protein [Paenibacillus dendritiformis]|uniref:ABC transporter ATP-binding protein n=1 Tax=Paenibacillus dendritiformis TaxID=130049 RepID=UPI00143DA7EA|nr:ABC transporter ATP-binding protein [Paenibacillus dendritiformis]NKI24249.1 ABC transporter ATP-binding protein [Paenibacillus dendritiformis]NRG00453.1 ABC transporter ATP-binding protein [Paenibacillus dendritiformis]
MNDNIAIEVTDVSMRYRLATEKITSMKHFIIKKLKKEITYQDFYALNNVNFTINKGEVFGIIGMNGAGKSTLLKIIAGILKPTSGEVNIKGSIAPLIELGAGFNGELTGMENIYLNGLILGYSKKFIKEKIDEIIEFSELEKFIYTPLKNYSSGMKARLGFSIATIVKPDILIVDEVLSVGDIKFQEKSGNKIRAMIDSGTTVLFVSHSLGQVEKLCDRVLWLDKGRVKLQSTLVAEVCKEFKSK